MSISRLSTLLWLAFLGLTITVVQSAELTVSDLSISTAESDGNVIDTTKLAANSKAGKTFEIDHAQQLKVTFKVTSGKEGFRPQQTFLRLTSATSGAAAFVVATKGASDGELVAKITSAAIAKQIGTQGGLFELALLLGDTSVSKPLQWVLADVTVKHAPLDDGKQPPSPVNKMDQISAPKIEISHVFRQPDKRPPAIVSLFFTIVVFIPLAGFSFAMIQLHANIKGFPQAGAQQIWALGFHAGILAILATYLVFWLGMNLMNTAPIVLGIGAVTAAFGSKALAPSVVPGGSVRSKQE